MNNKRPLIVAEFTTNHMGNLNILLRMVKMAKWAGADIIKMQKKDVGTFYTQEKLSSSYSSPYGNTFRDYRETFEFGLEDFRKFDACCKEHDIPWYTTIQDVNSVDFFKNFDLPMVKIASCNTRNDDLIKSIKESFPKIPFVFSIGGTTMERIEEIVSMFDDREVYIQQCTAAYPCPISQLYLGNITALKASFPDPRIHVGYSGHEEGWIPTLVAVALGAEIIERHFCISRDSFVHHIECSLEPDEFKDMTWTIEHMPDIHDTNFGMTDCEEKFLLRNTYGTDELEGGWTLQVHGRT